MVNLLRERYGKNEYYININLVYLYFQKVELPSLIIVLLIGAFECYLKDYVSFVFKYVMVLGIFLFEYLLTKNIISTINYKNTSIDGAMNNLQVRRKYTDFIWLYNILKKQFGNCIVPPFFKKKENLDINKMNKRVYFMEKFLNGIAAHPILRNSKYFYDFLSINDEKKFIKSKKEYEKNQPPLKIKQFKTLNGEIKVSLDEDTEDFFNKIKSELTYQDTIYEKLIYHYKLLLININQTVSQMKEISNIWKELSKIKNEYIKSETHPGIYNSYSKIMNQWADLQINHCNLISKSIKKFFRFIKEEYTCFSDLSIIVDNHKINYYKKNKKTLKEKENFFALLEKEEKEKNIDNNDNKEGIDKEIEFNKVKCKDVIKLNNLKREYGCYLNIYVNEYERLRNLNNNRFKTNLLYFID